VECTSNARENAVHDKRTGHGCGLGGACQGNKQQPKKLTSARSRSESVTISLFSCAIPTGSMYEICSHYTREAARDCVDDTWISHGPRYTHAGGPRQVAIIWHVATILSGLGGTRGPLCLERACKFREPAQVIVDLQSHLAMIWHAANTTNCSCWRR
jgi:hypothetical protein